MVDFASNRMRGDEDTCIPNFHYQVIQNVERTAKEGQPVFEEVEMVEIIIPGNDRERPCFRVTQEYKDRWPEQYKRFKEKLEKKMEDGYYLEEWPQITRSLAATLKHHHITTVEQLAQIPDSNLMNIGPGMLDLKYKAQKFVETMKDDVAVQKMAEELKQRDKKIELLESKLEELGSKLDDYVDSEPAKKSKPPTARSGKG